jgi:hypothetical protein
MSTKLHICTQRVMGTTSVAAPRLLSLTFHPFLTTCHRVQSGCSPFETCWSSQSTPLKAISQVVLPGNLWLWTDHASWATWKPVRGAFSGPSQGPLPRAPPKGASQGPGLPPSRVCWFKVGSNPSRIKSGLFIIVWPNFFDWLVFLRIFHFPYLSILQYGDGWFCWSLVGVAF